ncbi:CLUMA_CG011385, isoform A [Clunio marinus]|uniref:CLUMA_CG011385, isoform A n=1 Tax=Clunio marinus TaxID=568069 RepID=A0A1J1ICQ5_9DIPT|nr:CLUMA_CG011385, isoform A [Clunio marinus]
MCLSYVSVVESEKPMEKCTQQLTVVYIELKINFSEQQDISRRHQQNFLFIRQRNEKETTTNYVNTKEVICEIKVKFRRNSGQGTIEVINLNTMDCFMRISQLHIQQKGFNLFKSILSAHVLNKLGGT